MFVQNLFLIAILMSSHLLVACGGTEKTPKKKPPVIPKQVPPKTIRLVDVLKPLNQKVHNHFVTFVKDLQQELKETRSYLKVNSKVLKITSEEETMLEEAYQLEDQLFNSLPAHLKEIETALHTGIETDDQFFKLLLIYGNLLGSLERVMKDQEDVKAASDREGYIETYHGNIMFAQGIIKGDRQLISEIAAKKKSSSEDLEFIQDRTRVPYFVGRGLSYKETIINLVNQFEKGTLSKESVTNKVQLYISIMEWINTWADHSKYPLLTKENRKTITETLSYSKSLLQTKLGWAQ